MTYSHTARAHTHKHLPHQRRRRRPLSVSHSRRNSQVYMNAIINPSISKFSSGFSIHSARLHTPMRFFGSSRRTSFVPSPQFSFHFFFFLFLLLMLLYIILVSYQRRPAVRVSTHTRWSTPAHGGTGETGGLEACAVYLCWQLSFGAPFTSQLCV